MHNPKHQDVIRRPHGFGQHDQVATLKITVLNLDATTRHWNNLTRGILETAFVDFDSAIPLAALGQGVHPSAATNQKNGQSRTNPSRHYRFHLAFPRETFLDSVRCAQSAFSTCHLNCKQQ